MPHKSYKRKPEDPFTFDFGGEPTPPFRARGGMGSIVLELGELARLKDLDAESAEGLAAIADLYQMLLGPEEFARFREFVGSHDVDVDQMLEVMQDMFQAVVGVPLGEPPVSSPGPTSTPRTYKVISPSDGTVTELPLTAELEAKWLAEMERDLRQEIPGSS